MVEAPRHWQTAKTVALEFAHNMWRIPRSVRERGAVTPQQAQPFLYLAYKAHQDIPNEFFDGQIPVLGDRIGEGWHFTVYTFDAGKEPSVMKVGAEHSPMRGFPDPSGEQFATDYQYYLDAQQEIATKVGLPRLILPQKVLHIKDHQSATTLVFQVYIPPQAIRSLSQLSPQEQLSILEEYKKFRRFSMALRTRVNAIPDRLGDLLAKTSNLEIVQFEYGPHLTLLDNGLFSRKYDAPLMNTAADLMLRTRLAARIGLLKAKVKP